MSVTHSSGPAHGSSESPPQTPEGYKVDVWERTRGVSGPAEGMDRRLFMQLNVFDCDPAQGALASIAALNQALERSALGAVVYADVTNPLGVGVLSWSEDPADFVTRLRPCFEAPNAAWLRPRHDFTMIGRSYATGYENDLAYWLLRRPVETVLNEKWPWAVWYPLRRSGAFARLEGREQGAILREHGDIGRAYGEQDHAHDVRLACHGLDPKDNEFLIGLIGKELHPLSHVVQAMRRTRQTAEFISQMGPFFVGHVISRHAAK